MTGFIVNSSRIGGHIGRTRRDRRSRPQSQEPVVLEFTGVVGGSGEEEAVDQARFPALAPKTRVIGFNGTRCGGFGPKALKFAMENEVSPAVRGR